MICPNPLHGRLMAFTSRSDVALTVAVLVCLNIHQTRGKTYVHPSANVSVVETSSGFSLYYGRNFKVLENRFYNLTYLLLKDEAQSSGRDEILNILVFQEPLTNYTIDTPVPVGFLELLGNLNKLLGMSPSYVSSPCVLKFLSQGLIPIVDMTNLNETLTFTALFTSSSPGSLNGNNSVDFDCMYEKGPLKRAEWIKFLAAFFDLEERANYVYSLIETNYECLNESMKNRSPKPLVAWLTYNGGVWTFSNDAHKVQFNLDAGGLNLNSSILTMSFNMSEESDVSYFYDIIATVDVVIDETIAPDPTIYTLSNFTAAANISENTTAQFPFLSNNRTWRYDKRVGNNFSLDWYEGAVAQPQVVLGDLIEAFYPSGRNTTYLRNIAVGEGVVSTSTLDCMRSSITTRLEPTILSCNFNGSTSRRVK